MNFKDFCKNYTKVDNIAQINANTGICIMHYIINQKYITKLKERFERLLKTILLSKKIIFIYTDVKNENDELYIDNKIYGDDSTKYLMQIYNLIYPINNNIQIYYFCLKKNFKDNINGIIHIPYTNSNIVTTVPDFIADYITKYITK